MLSIKIASGSGAVSHPRICPPLGGPPELARARRVRSSLLDRGKPVSKLKLVGTRAPLPACGGTPPSGGRNPESGQHWIPDPLALQVPSTGLPTAEFGVEGVAHAVADEIDADHCEGDEDPGPKHPHRREL